MTASVVDALAEAASRARPFRACGAGPAHEAVLADRPDAPVVRHGPAAAKAHAGHTDPEAFAVRLAAAAHPLLDAGAGPSTLIDIDDLGLGAPTWDLARPGAWFAAGLLARDAWTRFLAAYHDEGGPAVPPAGDLWPQLDIPARALTVQTGAIGVLRVPAAQELRPHALLVLNPTKSDGRQNPRPSRRPGVPGGARYWD
ncbi:hypothetical protein [Streptomyces sp. HUAS TT7]|uniref:hypothetical protein n=1 Tax=Streptomyces sp. HUAS TT7 TaxID=3447507 RepID=UPI003F659E6D